MWVLSSRLVSRDYLLAWRWYHLCVHFFLSTRASPINYPVYSNGLKWTGTKKVRDVCAYRIVPLWLIWTAPRFGSFTCVCKGGNFSDIIASLLIPRWIDHQHLIIDFSPITEHLVSLALVTSWPRSGVWTRIHYYGNILVDLSVQPRLPCTQPLKGGTNGKVWRCMDSKHLSDSIQSDI